MVRDTVAVETLARLAISLMFIDPSSRPQRPRPPDHLICPMRNIQCVLHAVTRSIPPREDAGPLGNLGCHPYAARLSSVAPPDQKYKCNPSCTIRLGSAVRLMLPKFEISGSAFGSANSG